MPALDIAEVSRRSGVAASAIRFYEEKGLIQPVGRRGLRRLFAPDVIERLALISLGQSAGFSLAELASMLATGEPRIDRRMLAAKVEELDRRIGELTAMRDGLRHALACPAPSHMECPTFRRIVSAAARGAFRRRRRRSARQRV